MHTTRPSSIAHCQIRIRDLLGLTFLVACGLGWWNDRRDLVGRIHRANEEVRARDDALADAAREHKAERERLLERYWGTMGLIERVARGPRPGDQWRGRRPIAAGRVLSINAPKGDVALSFGKDEQVEPGDIVTAWRADAEGRECVGILRLVAVGKTTAVGHVMYGNVDRGDLAVGWQHGW